MYLEDPINCTNALVDACTSFSGKSSQTQLSTSARRPSVKGCGVESTRTILQKHIYPSFPVCSLFLSGRFIISIVIDKQRFTSILKKYLPGILHLRRMQYVGGYICRIPMMPPSAEDGQLDGLVATKTPYLASSRSADRTAYFSQRRSRMDINKKTHCGGHFKTPTLCQVRR